MRLKNYRLMKIIGILFFTLVSVLFIINYTNEVDFQRYPGTFGAYLNMLLGGFVNPNFELFPFFSSLPQTDPSLSPIAQQISVTESYWPNIIFIHMEMTYIFGLSPEQTIIIPFGLILVPIVYIGLLNSMINWKQHPFAFFLLSIYGLLFLFTTKSTSSFYAATPGYTLLFISIMCMWKYLQSNDARYYVLEILVLTSLAHYWHTALMMFMVLLASILFMLCIQFAFRIKKLKRSNELLPIISLVNRSKTNYFRNITSLALISIVCAITFTHLWQSNYIDEFTQNANIFEFIDAAIKKMMGGIPFEVPYQYNYKDTVMGNLYFSSYMAILAISSFMAIYVSTPILIGKKRVAALKTEVSQNTIILLIGLIIAQVVIVFLYYRTNSINFIYIPLLFPMVCTYAYLNINRDRPLKINSCGKVITCCLTLLIILSAICLFAIYDTNQAGETSITRYSDVQSSFLWSHTHIDGKSYQIYADFNILGKSLSYEAEISKPLTNYEHLDVESYSVLVGDSSITQKLQGQYVLVDYATMKAGLPIQVVDSRAALSPLVFNIDLSTNGSKIYQDSNISIYKFNDG